MSESILIVGAGQAGAQAIDTLRRDGHEGPLTLIGDEPALPYQRPPLSKKFLSGELAEERLPFRHRAFYEEHRVDLRLGLAAVGLDCAARTVTLADGSAVPYDRLLLCLGAASRRLSCPGADLPGVHYLRNLLDAVRLRTSIRPGARVLVIGGGYIGLETAATARAMGCEVTVLEMADRVMNRVVAPCVSAYFAADHAAHGIHIVCNTRVAALEGAGRVERIVCADGTVYAAELVIVGVGAIAAVDLAESAGLACDNGIIIDEFCRTSDAAVFAAGDCANQISRHYGRRVRLESVDNAFEQAKTASANMLGKTVVHDRVPWFWSDQFDNKLLIVGLSEGHTQVVVRGDPAARSFSVCYLKGRELLAVEAVNHSKDYMAGRKLIPLRAPLDPDKLGNAGLDLKDAV